MGSGQSTGMGDNCFPGHFAAPDLDHNYPLADGSGPDTAGFKGLGSPNAF